LMLCRDKLDKNKDSKINKIKYNNYPINKK
jgi:hypothetical protein